MGGRSDGWDEIKANYGSKYNHEALKNSRTIVNGEERSAGEESYGIFDNGKVASRPELNFISGLSVRSPPRTRQCFSSLFSIRIHFFSIFSLDIEFQSLSTFYISYLL